MSQVTVNGVNVLAGSIVMPLRGVWTADLVIDQPDGTGFDAGTSVSIVSEGGLTFTGTVAVDRSGDFLDAVHVRVLGGAGGMAKELSPRGYVQPGAFVRDVLNGIAGDTGEVLSADISPALLGTNLSAWNTFQQPASEGVNVLISIVQSDAVWRITADGKLLVVTDSWPSKSFDFEIINHDPAERTYHLGVDGFEIAPGMDVENVGKVARVEHVIGTNGHSRSHVWTQIEDNDRGTLDAVTKIVQQQTSHIDYFTLYDAKIVSQSVDLTTVDLQPGDTRLPGLSKVPLRLGIPGASAQVTPGGFIRLGWDRGNPSMPYAALWQGGETPIKLTLVAQTIELGGTNLIAQDCGVVLASGIDSLTGSTYGQLNNASSVVLAKKI